MLGQNLRAVQRRVGALHVSASLLTAVRACRPRINQDKMPIALRRGLIYSVIKTWEENRATYRHVMQIEP